MNTLNIFIAALLFSFSALPARAESGSIQALGEPLSLTYDLGWTRFKRPLIGIVHGDSPFRRTEIEKLLIDLGVATLDQNIQSALVLRFGFQISALAQVLADADSPEARRELLPIKQELKEQIATEVEWLTRLWTKLRSQVPAAALKSELDELAYRYAFFSRKVDGGLGGEGDREPVRDDDLPPEELAAGERTAQSNGLASLRAVQKALLIAAAQGEERKKKSEDRVGFVSSKLLTTQVASSIAALGTLISVTFLSDGKWKQFFSPEYITQDNATKAGVTALVLVATWKLPGIYGNVRKNRAKRDTWKFFVSHVRDIAPDLVGAKKLPQHFAARAHCVEAFGG